MSKVWNQINQFTNRILKFNRWVTETSNQFDNFENNFGSFCSEIGRTIGRKSSCSIEFKSWTNKVHQFAEELPKHCISDHLGWRSELFFWFMCFDHSFNDNFFFFIQLQGIAELTPAIRRWIYLATVFGPAALPIFSYSLILAGSFMLMYIFVRAYKNFVFHSDPTVEILEMGRRSIRRGSSFLIQHQHRIMTHHHHRDSYMLLKTQNNNDIDLLT